MAEKQYIERGAVYVDKQKAKSKMQYIFKVYGVSDALRNKINKALADSAADVVEVRHGEWQQYDQLYCSLCGVAAPFLDLAFKQIRSPYCHRCGAKMDGGETE